MTKSSEGSASWLGIGFYSLSKMGKLPVFAVSRGWTAFGLWTGGVLLVFTTPMPNILSLRHQPPSRVLSLVRGVPVKKLRNR